MRKLHSKGFAKGETVVWLLEGHQVDFSKPELTEIISGIKEVGILSTLRNQRPSLEGTLRQIVEDAGGKGGHEELDDATLQFLLEQCLLDLYSKVSR